MDWRGMPGLPHDFPAHMLMGDQQRRVARAGSLGGRAGGPGTVGLGKSCLAAVLAVVRLLEQKKGTRARVCSVHKGRLAGPRVVLGQSGSRRPGFQSADRTRMGHRRQQSVSES